MAEGRYTPAGEKILGQMHREMDKTREQWELEADQLRREFFVENSDQNGLNTNGIGDKLGGAKIGGVFNDSEVNGVLVEKDEISKTFTVKMDVSGYNVEDISIRVYGNRLTIDAKRNEVKKGKTITREFSRQVNVPIYVDPNSLTSKLTDGMLVIKTSESLRSQGHDKFQGHVPRSRSHKNHVTFSDDLRNSGFKEPKTEQSKAEPKNGFSDPGLLFTLKCPIFQENLFSSTYSDSQCKGRVIHIESDDVHRVKWIVDVGAGFTPGDIRVTAAKDKLQISGLHEEGSSEYKRSRKEYSREFNIPDNVDQSTLRATVGPDGKIVIRANRFT